MVRILTRSDQQQQCSTPLVSRVPADDLILGGAERLVVDAAIGLQKLGNEVIIFTSHHEHSKEGRSFEETKDGQFSGLRLIDFKLMQDSLGTLQVRVIGSIWPSTFFGGFSIVFAIIKQLHLAYSLLFSIFLYHLSQLPLIGAVLGLILIQDSVPVKNSNDWSFRRVQPPFDIIIMDQLSTCTPILRWIGATRVVFYCHFPDLLLSPHSSSSLSPAGPTGLIRLFSAIYRKPLNMIEEATTGEADKILVNSEFTSNIFEQTFPELKRRPRVVYPGIDVTEPKVKIEEKDRWIVKNAAPTLLSINRFEPKKDVALAVEAFSRAKQDHKHLRLVVAGASLSPSNLNFRN